MSLQEPFKMLFLLDDFRGPKGGGTEVQFINLLQSLDPGKVHAEISVLRPTEYTENHYAFPHRLTTLHLYKMFSLTSLAILLKLALRIRREKIRIVHIFFNDAAIIAPLFCRLGGAKVITSRRDMGFWYTRFNLFCLYFSNVFVNRIIANSDAVKSNVHLQEKFPLDRISVIYNGIDEARFELLQKGGFRVRAGVSATAPVIGIVANLDSIKRHRDLLEAFTLILDDFPDALLVLAGQGPEEPQLRELSETLKITDKVLFLGSVAAVLPVIADFDISVLTSESEGLSNAIIEYMGCGKPVVCTNTGGNPELIIDGYNGCLVPVGDVEALAGKLRMLLSSPALMKELGGNGIKRFRETFGIAKMLNSQMELYYTLCE